MDFLWSAGHEQLVCSILSVEDDPHLSIRPRMNGTRSGHQGQSHTSGPISAEAFRCRKSRRVLGRDEDRFHLNSIDSAEIGQLSMNSGSCARVTEYDIIASEYGPADAHQLVSECAYGDMRVHTKPETAYPSVQRVVPFVLPHPECAGALNK